MREPETLKELKAEILRQLEHSETVTIRLTEGDSIHELLNEIDAGIHASEKARSAPAQPLLDEEIIQALEDCEFLNRELPTK